MNALLDTTVFWDDPNLKSGAWAVLKEYARRTGAVVFVPAVVVDEAKVNFERRLTEAESVIKSARNTVARFIDGSFRIDDLKMQNEVRRYAARLESKFKEYSIKVLAYPNVSHPDIVRLQARCRRPFQAKGTGYRDYLIWAALLKELTRWANDCVIVTKNVADFSANTERPEQLHEHLLSDLRSAGVKAKVTVARTLDEFLDKYAKPGLQRLDSLRNQIQSGKVINLPKFLAGVHEQMLSYLNDNAARLLHLRRREFHTLEDPIGVAYLDDNPMELRVKDVRRLSKHENFVILTTVYDGQLFGHLRHSDALSLGPESALFIVDSDWNEEYAQAGASITLEIEFRVVYKTRTKKIVGWEIVGAQTDADNYLS